MSRGLAAGFLVFFLMGNFAVSDVGLCADKKKQTWRPEWSPVRLTSATLDETIESEDHADSILDSPVDRTRTINRVSNNSGERSDPDQLPDHRVASLDRATDALYLHDDGSVQFGDESRCGSPSCSFCRDFFRDRIDGGLGYPYWIPQFQGGWVRAEYLLWWAQGDHVPALVTTSTAGTPQPQAGVLGQPNTSILFGSTELNDGVRSGGRLNLGVWIDPCLTTAIEASYFALEREATSFQAVSSGDPILARPFFNVQTGTEDARVIAFTPPDQSGSIAVGATTQFQGAELSVRQVLDRQNNYVVAGLIGYRFQRLDDDVRISESLTTAGPTTVELFDVFDTRNDFHGAQIGGIGEMRYGRLTAELKLALALGVTHSKVLIDGATMTTVGGGAPTTTTGGLLTQSSNIGIADRDDFSVVPEMGLTVGVDITKRLKATLGYSFIYWSRVARAGDQIDRDLNLPLIPGGPVVGAQRPASPFAMTDYWAQGINFSLAYAF